MNSEERAAVIWARACLNSIYQTTDEIIADVIKVIRDRGDPAGHLEILKELTMDGPQKAKARRVRERLTVLGMAVSVGMSTTEVNRYIHAAERAGADPAKIKEIVES